MICNLLEKKPFQGIYDFFYSYAYPLMLALVSVLCFTLRISVIGFAFFGLCACVSLVLVKDLTVLLPPLALFLYCFSSVAHFGSVYVYVIGGIIGACLIAHIILNLPKKFYLGELFAPLCFVTVALLLAGVFSNRNDTYVDGLLVMFGTGPVILVIYFLFSNYLNPPKWLDFKKYFCFLMVLSALTGVCTLFLSTYMERGFISLEVLRINVLYTAWGNSNTLASLILIATPCTCYLLSRAKYQLPWFFVIFLLLFSMYVTGSDGALAILIISFPFLALATFFQVRNKRQFLIITLAIITLALFALFVISLKIDLIELAKGVFNTSDSGRFFLWSTAINLYKKYPVFGAGLGYMDLSIFNPAIQLLRQSNFHSVLFHVMATMGTFGLICYGIYYYKRFNVLLKRFTSINVFSAYSFAMFTLYALIDTSEFNLFPLMSFMTLVIVITELNNEGINKYHDLKENFYKERKFSKINF